MCIVFLCDSEERVLGTKHATGNCPYCGGAVMLTDVESQLRLCFLPLRFKTKRRYSCTRCSRRLVLYP
ncbi:hypothetical protein ZOSMA_11G00350 [Zostera marina]|uniref:Methionyl-tRNA synthetase n=1 Tax=Zostera marina TaxID=29655 RepID=A0A0K9Q1H3_ZOSMR|nr:hypothetical protein ZOSMA_11G00350 [Zostera marina]